MTQWKLYDDNFLEANRIVNNPTGERALHYKVIVYIKESYPQEEITLGLEENQITHLLKGDSFMKGQSTRTPDIKLKCELSNGHTDVVAIDS